MHAFHVFPKTEYLMRSMALFCLLFSPCDLHDVDHYSPLYDADPVASYLNSLNLIINANCQFYTEGTFSL